MDNIETQQSLSSASSSVLSVVVPTSSSLLSCSERVTTAFQRQRQQKQQKEQEQQQQEQQEQQVNIDDAGSLLAKEMNKLTLNEREAAYEDIHGVRQVIEETDELIQSALYEMDIEISNIITTTTTNHHHSNNNYNNYNNTTTAAAATTAYIVAKQISYEYVTNFKLRLMFLRSCRFHIKKATKKFILFFEEKLLYFGKYKLCKTITLLDLNHEDINCLKSGRFQLLPYRDRTGRPIVSIYLNKIYNYKSHISMLRAFFYFFMSIVENDIENQKRGFVFLHFTTTDTTVNTNTLTNDNEERILQQKCTKFTNALPVTISSVHFCLDNYIFVTVLSTIINIIESSTIPTRIRFHHGSTQIEYYYSLLTFGIPIDFIPLTNDNKIKIDNHLKWLQRRQYMENILYNTNNNTNNTNSNINSNNITNTTTTTIVTPTVFLFNGINLPNKYDILIGKGKPIQNSTGNIYLRDIIDEYYLKEYHYAERGTKDFIVYKVIQHIKSTKGGRFLQQTKKAKTDGGWWYEVSDDIAYKKVVNRFRRSDADNNYKNNNNNNNNSSKATATIILSNNEIVNKNKNNNNHTTNSKKDQTTNPPPPPNNNNNNNNGRKKVRIS